MRPSPPTRAGRSRRGPVRARPSPPNGAGGSGELAGGGERHGAGAARPPRRGAGEGRRTPASMASGHGGGGSERGTSPEVQEPSVAMDVLEPSVAMDVLESKIPVGRRARGSRAHLVPLLPPWIAWMPSHQCQWAPSSASDLQSSPFS
ncbi:unnamed protein product [Miscanthus lutarioriparius]|uniref:Uncharacterized protein n=1 Tax=Miscanthus lutarioriparius TaxID=422564 RepID=A0A811NYV4_9POAL|nr:unnamed protein product [Miscanthus lutarioriparius]